MWDFGEWYKMKEKEPETFTLIAYTMDDETWPFIKIGVFDGSEIHDESGGGIVLAPNEIDEWTYLGANPEKTKDLADYNPYEFVKAYRKVRNVVENYIYARTGLTDIHLADLKILAEPKGTQIRPDLYMGEIGFNYGYTEYAVYLGITGKPWHGFSVTKYWLNFQALEDCTKRRL